MGMGGGAARLLRPDPHRRWRHLPARDLRARAPQAAGQDAFQDHWQEVFEPARRGEAAQDKGAVHRSPQDPMDSAFHRTHRVPHGNLYGRRLCHSLCELHPLHAEHC